MGESKFVLRVKKVKSQLLITASGNHNFRETVSDNVDSTRTHLNENLGKTANSAELSELVQNITSAENLTKDAKSTKVMEFIISASPEQLASESFDEGKYFRDALKWAESKHGAENVVSAVIHRDEDTPHLHLLVVPINKIEATTRNRSVSAKGGGREIREFVVPAHQSLSANVQYGGPSKLSELQTDFELKVGKPHGLYREQRYFSGQDYKKEGYVSPRKFKQELIEREKVLSAKEKEVEALRAELAVQLDNDKMWTAELNQYRVEAAAKLVKLDQELAAVKDQAAAVALDRQALVAGFKKLEAEKAEQTGFFNGIKIKLDQREEVVQEKETAADALERERTAKIAEVKTTLGQWELGIKQDRAALDRLMAGHTPDQIAGALTVIETTKKKGIDMEHLTQGDCVIILGKTWADKKGIRTAEDMMKPADPDDAAWARRVGLPKPKPDNQTQGVKR